MRISAPAFTYLTRRDAQPICAQAIAADAVYNIYSIQVGCSVKDPYRKLDDVLHQCGAQNAPFPTTSSENWPTIFAGAELSVAAAALTSAAFVTCIEDIDRGDTNSSNILHYLLFLAVVPAAAGVVWGVSRMVKACWLGPSAGPRTAPQTPTASNPSMLPAMGAVELDDISMAPPPPAYAAGYHAPRPAAKSAVSQIPDVGSAS